MGRLALCGSGLGTAALGSLRSGWAVDGAGFKGSGLQSGSPRMGCSEVGRLCSWPFLGSSHSPWNPEEWGLGNREAEEATLEGVLLITTSLHLE